MLGIRIVHNEDDIEEERWWSQWWWWSGEHWNVVEEKGFCYFGQHCVWYFKQIGWSTSMMFDYVYHFTMIHILAERWLCQYMVIYTCRIWCLKTLACRAVLCGHAGDVNCVAVCHLVASGSADKSIRWGLRQIHKNQIQTSLLDWGAGKWTDPARQFQLYLVHCVGSVTLHWKGTLA